MSTLNYTYTTLPDGTTALGTQVMKNFNDVRAVINGLTQENIATGAVDSDEIATGAVTANKLASDSVIEAKVDYSKANSGVKAIQYGPDYTNVGAGGLRFVRVHKVMSVTTATTVQTLNIDWGGGDGVDGSTTFESPPTVVGIEIEETDSPTCFGASTVLAAKYVTEITETGCIVNIRFSVAASAGDIIIHLTVLGPVA
ncbi:MAG: hypothetical protein OEV86_12970 [Candidatus Krumholzibacteria bacterium]|nr:hypothetical protein [Candidatus Krumholzibacteria bacterium]